MSTVHILLSKTLMHSVEEHNIVLCMVSCSCWQSIAEMISADHSIEVELFSGSESLIQQRYHITAGQEKLPTYIKRPSQRFAVPSLKATFFQARQPTCPLNFFLVVYGMPPPVADEEFELPRGTRVIRAELKLAYCSSPSFFLSRLDFRVLNICPALHYPPLN